MRVHSVYQGSKNVQGNRGGHAPSFGFFIPACPVFKGEFFVAFQHVNRPPPIRKPSRTVRHVGRTRKVLEFGSPRDEFSAELCNSLQLSECRFLFRNQGADQELQGHRTVLHGGDRPAFFVRRRPLGTRPRTESQLSPTPFAERSGSLDAQAHFDGGPSQRSPIEQLGIKCLALFDHSNEPGQLLRGGAHLRAFTT